MTSLSLIDGFDERLDVRFWHMTSKPPVSVSAFGGKADIADLHSNDR
jgi:hypothetical protein